MKNKAEVKSKKHQGASRLVDKNRAYEISEAVDLVKKSSYSKFDASVELHINLDINIKSPDQTVRTTAVLPNGSGKAVRVVAFSTGKIKSADSSLSDEGVSLIEQGKIKPGTDFDVVVSEPSFMPKLAKIAKILGPKGMMPNPKNGTVSDNLEAAVAEIKKGKVEIRNEANAPIIHLTVGKTSFASEKLAENIIEVFKVLRSHKPQKADPNWIKSCFLTATMSPSVKLNLESL